MDINCVICGGVVTISNRAHALSPLRHVHILCKNTTVPIPFEDLGMIPREEQRFIESGRYVQPTMLKYTNHSILTKEIPSG